jgi:hypothetical protein
MSTTPVRRAHHAADRQPHRSRRSPPADRRRGRTGHGADPRHRHRRDWQPDGLNPWQALTSVQVPALTTAQIAAIDPVAMAVAGHADLSRLSTAQIRAFTLDQWGQLSTLQIVGPEHGAVRRHLVHRHRLHRWPRAWRPWARRSLLRSPHARSPHSRPTRSPACRRLTSLRWARTSCVSLSADQLMALTTAGAAALTSTQVQAFTTAQINALEADDLAALGTAQFAACPPRR